MKWLDRKRTLNTLRRHPIPHEPWHRLMHEAAMFGGLTPVERAHLRTLTTQFLDRKTFSGARGLELTTDIMVAVAAQACF